jgi:hypothetical protein
MKIARTLITSLVLAAAGSAMANDAPLAAFEAARPGATPPALYSFADLYRLTLAGESFAAPRWSEGEAQLRLASRVEPPEPRFSVSAPRDGGRWPLLLAGLAACAWVAHRRLASPY